MAEAAHIAAVAFGASGGLAGLLQLLAAAVFALLLVVLSLWFSLGLHRAILVAIGRCVVQLVLLAYLLAPAFALGAWWATLAYAAAMLLVSAIEAVSRPPAAHEGMLRQTLLAMGAATAATLAVAAFAVLRPSPWHAAAALLPAAGLVLSHTVAAVSRGLGAALQELTEGRERVEALLAMGASRHEAAKGVVQRALAAVLAPALAQISVLGLAALPDFLGGQLFAGAPPLQAAQAQVSLVLLAVTGSALAAAGAVVATVLTAVDASHRLRADSLVPRRGRDAGVAQWLHAQTVKAWQAARGKSHRALARIRVSMAHGRQQPPRPRGWVLQSPLARRILGRGREESGDLGSLDSRLRGVGVLGPSDDEGESILSGVLSDGEELPRHPFGRSPRSAG